MIYKILNGNDLLIQGALEAGFHPYTYDAGLPLTDFFIFLHERKDELHKSYRGVRYKAAEKYLGKVYE